MYQEITITKMPEILDLISDQPFDKRNGRNRGYYLYRGLPNAKYHLETSLYRNCLHLRGLLEPKLLQNFEKYTAAEANVDVSTVWKRMVLGQHHGLPTRLLDWTHSPLVGLHFAVSDSDFKTLDQNDCVLWRIDIEDIHEHLPEEFKRVSKRECANVFSIDMLNEVAESTETYDRLTQGTSMVIMEPPSIDPRIVNQYAFFSVIPGQVDNIEEFLSSFTTKTVKYIISKELKWRIRDFLDEANVSERTIYPGLDGICKWLARHYFVK